MRQEEALLRPAPLPIERVVFDGPLARVGAFRCPPEHPLFADSGPIVNPIFVFPRTAVSIQHDGGTPFVADPTIATLYNRGAVYGRRQVTGDGDHCDWFALDPRVLADIATMRDPAALERPDRPFDARYTTIDGPTYLMQRRLMEAIGDGRQDALFVEEQVVWLARRVLEHAADRTSRPPARRRMSARTARLHRDHVEHARLVLTRHPEAATSLVEVARLVGVSVFHLCRVFRRRTGLTLHEYRTQLRLRLALERLSEPRPDLTRTALDLGFSSHSHFTAAFRQAFGLTPSAFVRQARAGGAETER